MMTYPTLLQLNIPVAMQWLFVGPALCRAFHLTPIWLASSIFLLCQVCVALKDCLLVTVQTCFGYL